MFDANTVMFIDISIHVPTRGTTGVVNTVDGGKEYFNPRPHEGDDSRNDLKFRLSKNFNPRPHEGDDVKRFVALP